MAHPFRSGRGLLVILAVVTAGAVSAAPEPLLDFPAEGSLQCTVSGGTAVQGTQRGGVAGQLSYVPGHTGQGLYLPRGYTVTLPVPRFKAAAGTISFWFRPDWSPGDCTFHTIFALDASPAFKLDWRKGYNDAISPDYCYLLDPDLFTVSFHSDNLFTGRTWRHYAIRFSQERGQIDVVVDGDTTGWRSGKFPAPKAEAPSATLTLPANACGAFDDVRVYDRWLTVPELAQAAGLKQVAGYLQEQVPPPGGAPGAGQPVTYVDPATGRAATTSAPAEGETGPPSYNPARMPQLPRTPHTKWARPLAGGPVRLLMIARTGFDDEYSMIREAAELWQRLDCDIEVISQPDAAAMARDYDAILVTLQGFTNGRWAGWDDLDPKLREWIVDRVKTNRSGLVWAYPLAPNGQTDALFATPGRNDELLRGLPVTSLPQINGKDGPFRWDAIYALNDSFFLTPEEAGKLLTVSGQRLVKLAYKNGSWNPNMGLTPDSVLNGAATDVHYDEWMALAARAILIAAGRTPQAKIASAVVEGNRCRVEVTGLTAPGRLTYRARDAWGRDLGHGEVAQTAAGTTTLALRALPPRAFVDLILRNARGEVLDWYSAATPPPGNTRLGDISLDKASVRRGETISGRVRVSGAPPAGAALDVYLCDHANRRLLRQTLSPAATTRFTLKVPPSSDSLLMRVNAVLRAGNAILDDRSADCPVPQEPDGFYPLMYGPRTNRTTERLRREMLRDDFGVRGGFHQGSVAFGQLAAQNLNCIEYSGHLGYPSKRSDCEDFAENWEQNVTKWLLGPPEKMIPYHPLFYSLGEEHFVLMGSCPTPTANAKFRQWLQGKYASLDQLNTLWGSKYQTWDEISMIDPEIVDMLQLKYDVVRFENRRFMEHLFAARHAFLADYLRKVDPTGRTGIHAGWDLWMGRGYDYWLLSRAMEDMMCYGGPHNHYARSFFDRYWGSHYHYNIGSHGNARWHPWYMVLSGARGWSWYTDAPQIWGATTADLHLATDFAAAAPEFRAAAEAGDLLTRARYRDEQVAIHYSQDSFQAGVSHLTWIHQRFINLFFDCGVPFRFVSYEQVAQGDLLKRLPKLLVLPHSVSLTPAECDAIRAYVAAGGVVWADVLPGTYDHHGRRLEQSQLADLFATPGPHGKGHVILRDLGNYSYDRNVGSYAEAAKLYAEVAKTARLAPPAQALDAKTRGLANGIWTAAWSNGSALHVAVTKDYQLADQQPAAVVLKLDRTGHVYELRSGKYFGRVNEVTTTLAPASGQVFTVLPYRVQGLQLTPLGKAARGQNLALQVKQLITGGKPGAADVSVLKVTVTGPDGREVKALRRTLTLKGGAGTVRLPLAWDDAPGRWQVTVRDLATGLKQTVAYRLP